MSNRIQIVNTLDGIEFTKYSGPLRGKDGCIKIGSCCGRNITIEGRCFNRGSMIDFLNVLNPQLNLLKSCAKSSEIRAAYDASFKKPIEVIADPEDPVVVVTSLEPEVIVEPPNDEIKAQDLFDINLLPDTEVGLYHGLKPIEQELYQLAYGLGIPGQNRGAFADLLLLLIRGKVKGFSQEDNQVTIELDKGICNRKVLGRDLKAILPERLVFNIDKENQEISFIQGKISLFFKIFFNEVEILTPRGVSIKDNGVKINGELTAALKISKSEWVLNKTLSVHRIYKLFS